MIGLIVTLVVVAVGAALLGYSGVARGASRTATVLGLVVVAAIALVLALFYWAGGGWL